MNSTEERLEKLEIMLAYQDQQLQELNEVVIAQGDHIAVLKKRVEKANSKITELELTSGDTKDDSAMTVSEIAARDKPPHY